MAAAAKKDMLPGGNANILGGGLNIHGGDVVGIIHITCIVTTHTIILIVISTIKTARRLFLLNKLLFLFSVGNVKMKEYYVCDACDTCRNSPKKTIREDFSLPFDWPDRPDQFMNFLLFLGIIAFIIVVPEYFTNSNNVNN